MAAPVTEDQWNAVRESLRATCERFIALASSAPDAGTKATVKWSVADIAAHLAAVAWMDTTLLQVGADPFPMPGLAEGLAATAVDDVHGFNDVVMSYFPERDLSANLAILRHHIDLMLSASENRAPTETFAWLADAQLPLAGMLAHMINELLIHGNDIARAVKVPWTMPPADAALFFELFYLGLALGDPGRVLDGSKRPRKRRIAVELHSDYTTPITFVVQNGQLTTEPVGRGADAKVTFDPASLNMMLFGRISPLRAVMTRGLVVRGPRPWLLPAFLRTARAPSRRNLTA